MNEHYRKFFFDTANIDYIKNCWDKLSHYFYKSNVVGITTNPSALNKISCNSLGDLEKLIPKLCSLVTEIRGASLHGGEVYVQIPNSNLNKKEVLEFANFISKLSDGKTHVGLKIPPYQQFLEMVNELDEILPVNVTGVSDCSTALKCLAYKIRYVSILAGRMEEKGINAKEHVQYINNLETYNFSEIITGSMRTIEGLRWVIKNKTVPTIGTRVFDQILTNETSIRDFSKMWETFETVEQIKFSPLVNQDMINLSESFFLEMDNLGNQLCNEWKEKTNE